MFNSRKILVEEPEDRIKTQNFQKLTHNFTPKLTHDLVTQN